VQTRGKHAPQSDFVPGYCSPAAPPTGFLMAPASGYCLQTYINSGKSYFRHLLLTDCAAVTASIFSAAAEKSSSHKSITLKERTETSYSCYFPSEPPLEGFPCCFQPTNCTSKKDGNPACFVLLE